MKKILIVSPTPSRDAFAGNRLRVKQIGRLFLERGYEVVFVYIAREVIVERERLEMIEEWSRYYEVSYDRTTERKNHDDKNLEIDEWVSADVFEQIRAINDIEQPQVVLINYVFLSRLCGLAKEWQTTIIDTHDIFANRFLELKKLGLPPSFFSVAPEGEKKALKRSDLVLAITDEDACYIKKTYGIDAIVVNYFEKNEPVKLAKSPKIGYFSGNNKINVSSFVEFIKSKGVSEIAFKLKGLEIIVAGTICADSEVVAVANANKNLIQLMGPIADKAKFYQSVGAVINPQVSGTGQKIKTVEALSYGVPIISYYEGLKGVCDEKSDYVVVDEVEFSDRLDKFITNSEFRRTYSKTTRSIWNDYKKKIDGQTDLLMSAVNGVGKTKLLQKEINNECCKVLLIADFPFWKDKNGKSARVDAVVKSVPDFVELHVFAFCSIGRIDRALIEEKYPKVVFHSFKEYEVAEAAYFEERLLSRLTGIERKKYSRSYFSAIQEFLKAHTFDWAIIEYIYLAYLRFAVNFPPRKIIDTHDVMHLREWTFSKFDKKHWLSVAPREELQLLDEFELVLTIQYEEHDYLSMHLGQKSLIVPHIPIKTVLGKRNPSSQKLRIGFIGTDSPMNLDGIRYVIPMLGDIYQPGKFELIVAGSVCNNLREEKELPFVKVLGIIDRPESFYEDIDLTINPCFYGGGLKIKTIESIANGIPVIGAYEAFRGMPVDRMTSLPFIAVASESAFLHAIEAVCLDRNYLKEMQACCTLYLDEYFSEKMYSEFWRRVKL